MYSGTGYDLWRQARRLTQLATRGAAWLLWFQIEIRCCQKDVYCL